MFLFLLVVYYQYHISQCEGSLRIYGGRDALRGEFPYVVRIEEHTTLFLDGETKTHILRRCTGAALSSAWILSAAHCVDKDDFTSKNEKLVARYNSYFPKYLGETRTIFEVKIHPTYSSLINHVDQFVDVLKNDLCLFRSEGILVERYGKLSSVDFRSLIGHEAYTLGFGRTNASELEKPLQVLKGMLYDCNKKHDLFIYMLCLVPQCGVQNTICAGDSGGPIVHRSGIVGVNSMAEADCDEHSTSLDAKAGTEAAVLSTVSGSFDWISNIIGNS